jgi:hypothetical protein
MKRKFTVVVSREVVQQRTFDIEIDVEDDISAARLRALIDIEAIYRAASEDFSGTEKDAEYRLEGWEEKEES